jgi:hypothetical protein
MLSGHGRVRADRTMRFFLFGSLRGQKRRARDVDLVVELEADETVDAAMARVAEIAPRVRKPMELWLSRSESEPNLAGNYDYKSERWAFWRRPGQPGYFRGLEPVTLDLVVKLSLAVGPYGPNRRGGSPQADAGPDCVVRPGEDGWQYELEGETGGPCEGPLEAAAAAERNAKTRGLLDPMRVLWFKLERPLFTASL